MPTQTHHSLDSELRHLQETADRGESPATPVILIGEIVILLLPIALVLLSAAFAAYYLT